MIIHQYNFKPDLFLAFVKDNAGIFEADSNLRLQVVRNILIDIFFKSDKDNSAKSLEKKQYALQSLSLIIEHNPQFIFLDNHPGNNLFYSTLTLAQPKLFEHKAVAQFTQQIIQAAIKNKSSSAKQDILDKAALKNFIKNYSQCAIFKPVLDEQLLSIKTLKLLTQLSQKHKKFYPIFEKYLLSAQTLPAIAERKNLIIKI